MPCTYYGPGEHEAELRKDLNLLSAMLCGLCEQIEGTMPESFSFIANAHPRLSIWWEEHKRQDAERRDQEAREREREALRSSALSKLTDEEREAVLRR